MSWTGTGGQDDEDGDEEMAQLGSTSGPEHQAQASRWSAATSAALARRRVRQEQAHAKPKDVFFLINYVNFSNFRFAVLSLECDFDTRNLDPDDQRQLSMHVPADLQVQTSLEFFREELDLQLEWQARWYKIAEHGSVPG